MAHLALYREFRPQTFDDVIGQDQIVKTLKNQIETNTISHAYLFCGTRGTGKTSCAKIFARAVNCESPKNGSACGKCDVCKKIQSNGNLDIIEIDAASNNRVDEIRDLRDKVGYLPTVGKYKVYIIDEVHMLTDSAFNALLKTLEEPPAHVIFILATTEPEKLPATILSRCMRFNFKLIGIKPLTELLKKIFKQTNTKYDEMSLELIAKAGKGSVRDTLSIAEMCKSYSADNITTKSAVECLGLTDENTLFKLAKSLTQKDSESVLQIVDSLYDAGKNLEVLIDDLCDYFKDILTLKFDPKYKFELPDDVVNHYKEIASLCDEKYLFDALKKLCESKSQIKFSTNDKVFCETALLSIFYSDNLEIEMLKQRIEALEQDIKNISQYGILQQNEQKNANFDKKNDKNELKSQNPIVPEKYAETKVIQNIDKDISSVEVKNSTQISSGQIFGELIASARNGNEFMLLSSLNEVNQTSLDNNIFIIECVSADAKLVIDDHKTYLDNFLKHYQIDAFRTIIVKDSESVDKNKLSELLDGKLKIK